MEKMYSGECSHTKGIQSISVRYQYIQMTGTLTSNYKKNEF